MMMVCLCGVRRLLLLLTTFFSHSHLSSPNVQRRTLHNIHFALKIYSRTFSVFEYDGECGVASKCTIAHPTANNKNTISLLLLLLTDAFDRKIWIFNYNFHLIFSRSLCLAPSGTMRYHFFFFFSGCFRCRGRCVPSPGKRHIKLYERIKRAWYV